jgi:hypothetical protein
VRLGDDHSVSVDQTWLDRNAAWWAMLDRQKCLRSLRDQVEQYSAANPYEVAPPSRPTHPIASPAGCASGIKSRSRAAPSSGDIVHNLRSALDSLAYEMAVPQVGRPLKDAELN